MLPYQHHRRRIRQVRVSNEIQIARLIQQQHPEWDWATCLVEARKDLGTQRSTFR